VRFADATGLEVKLVYYPPYHSKYNLYNLIERCWASWKTTGVNDREISAVPEHLESAINDVSLLV
jgi:Rhodopirellula transposase DDE domain